MNYTENQSMRKLWWLMLPVAIIVSIKVGYWFTEADAAVKEDALTGVIISTVIGALVIALFFSMKLKTKIDAEGITYSFKPFVKQKNHTWAEFDKVWVRKYKPLIEYGGWGLRGGFGKGTAYSIWGKYGLQLNFKNGKQILIGSQKQEELATFLKTLKEKHNIDVIANAKLNPNN